MKSMFLLYLLVSVLIVNNAIAAESVWDKSTETYSGDKDITVYRAPDCGCCRTWIKHLKKHHFNVTDVVEDDMDLIKSYNNVPKNLASCHTAIIDGYVIEGHVPADVIKRLLKEKPDVVGLSVPKMPVGTPGMEKGSRKDPFSVFKFTDTGESAIYKEYLTY